MLHQRVAVAGVLLLLALGNTICTELQRSRPGHPPLDVARVPMPAKLGTPLALVFATLSLMLKNDKTHECWTSFKMAWSAILVLYTLSFIYDDSFLTQAQIASRLTVWGELSVPFFSFTIYAGIGFVHRKLALHTGCLVVQAVINTMRFLHLAALTSEWELSCVGLLFTILPPFAGYHAWSALPSRR